MDYVCDKNKNMKPVRCLDKFGGTFFSFDLSIDHNLFLITKKHTKDETNLEQKNIAFITNVNVVLCISSRNYNIKRVFNFKT